MTKIIVCNNCNTKLDINKLKYTYIYEEKEEGDLFVDNNVGLLCPYCKARIEEKGIYYRRIVVHDKTSLYHVVFL